MQFIISRNTLLNALMKLRPFIRKDNEHKEFFFTFNEAEASSVTIHAVSSGSEHISVRVPLDAPVVSPRNISVYYTFILRPLKTLDEQPLRFEVGEYQMKVFHSCGSFGIPLESDTDYTMLLDRLTYDIDTDKKNCFHLEYEAPGLRSIFNRLRFAMANDELRPALNGVYFNYTSEFSDYVSSEGHILARVRKSPVCCGCAANKPRNLSFIIPAVTVNSLLRILPTTGDVKLDVRKVDDYKAFARLTIDDYITLYFRPIEGRYPKYWSVIPETHNIEMTVNRQQLIKSVDRLTFFTDSHEVLKMNIYADSVHLSVTDKDYSMDGEETLPCETRKVDGSDMDGFRIGHMPSRLSSILKRLSTENVVFHFINSKVATLIYPQTQPDVEEITMLLMPMIYND